MGEIRAETLVDKVVAGFLEDLRQGVITPGDKLPSHERLQKSFGVSRNTLREALNRLESLGVLRIRHGDGTYVNHIDAASSINSLTALLKLKGAGLAELIEMRIFVEEKTAALAAARATEAEERGLALLLDDMRRAIDTPERFALLDTQFHQAIAEAAHNAILLEFMRIICDLMAAQQIAVARLPQVSPSSLRFHEEIFTSIRAKDGVKAAETMRHHIERAYSRFMAVDCE